MGILRKFSQAWKQATTIQKVETILDLLCGVGSGIASVSVTNKLTEGQNKLSKFFVGLTVTGLSLAAGDTASKALTENYGVAIANVIDRAKSGMAVKEDEEDSDNE